MHADLYKDRLTRDKNVRQADRRQKLLEEQRQKRNDLIDSQRSVGEPAKFTKKKTFRGNSNGGQFKGKLQLSEWWMDRPDDIENWTLRPCPKGVRCLVVANDGRTEAYSRNGRFMMRFRSTLPGGDVKSRSTNTILDCFYVEKLASFFVIDALVYKDQDLTECEASFRFFWIKSRLEESELDQVTSHNQHCFRWIEACSMNNVGQLDDLLSKYPLWPSNNPELDGLLFYHNESPYIAGESPLVLWLFAFMLPEVLNIPQLNQEYLMEKPEGYTSYLQFIEEFNATKRKNRRKSNRKCPMQCDEEVDREIDAANILLEQRNLELNDSVESME